MKQYNNIRHIRVSKGYSQNYVANCLKKSQSALSKIENGYTNISDETFEQLSKILEVPKEKLRSKEQLIIDCNHDSGYGFYDRQKNF